MRSFLVALSAFLLSAGTSFAQEPSPTLPASPIAYTDLVHEEPEATDAFAQCDSRWGGLRLGNATVCKQGCMFMSYATALIEQGLYDDPREVHADFTKKKLYDPRTGKLYTGKIAAAYPSLDIIERTEKVSSPSKAVSSVETALRKDSTTVLLKLSQPRLGMAQHWVRAVRTMQGDIQVFDPRFGTIGPLADFYRIQPLVKTILTLGWKP